LESAYQEDLKQPGINLDSSQEISFFLLQLSFNQAVQGARELEDVISQYGQETQQREIAAKEYEKEAEAAFAQMDREEADRQRLKSERERQQEQRSELRRFEETTFKYLQNTLGNRDHLERLYDDEYFIDDLEPSKAFRISGGLNDQEQKSNYQKLALQREFDFNAF
jgi:hypothetical protein